MEAFVGNSSPYSSATVTATAKQKESSGLQVNGVNPAESLPDRFAPSSYSAEGGPPSVSWDRRQLYMNPQSFNISDQKLVQKSLTKGGFVVQYWGEELATIAVQGTTGSSGVEGINILRDIYRHEQLHYRTILANRQREVAAAAAAAQAEAEEQIYDSFGEFLVTGLKKAAGGVANTIDTLFGSSLGDNFGGTGGTFRAVPTLAAFATNIDMYYQGEFFRGYFTNFTVTESASEPGHFSYTFNFVVTRRSGKRENFMPWHRNPVSFDGDTVMSQSTTEGKGSWPGVERLSFLPEETWVGSSRRNNPDFVTTGSVSSEFTDDESAGSETQADNQVPVNRRNSINNGSS